MILVDDVFVYVDGKMPSGINEVVSPNPDGTYTIILNSSLSKNMQIQAFWHAIGHIENNDFERVEKYGIQQIESEAHEREVDYEKKTDNNNNSFPDDIDVRIC